MTYTLYYSPGAASFAVHWMLIELRVPFETVKLDIDAKEHKSSAYLKLNPAGMVPTLIVDGRPQTEAAALLLLLAERHPGAALAPPLASPSRADYLQWMLTLANGLQPAFRSWFYPHEAAGEANVDAAKAEARKKIEALWARIDERLSSRKFLIGEQLSAPDLMATMLMRWSRNMPKPAHAWPSIGVYLAAMKQMASLREVHAREGLSEWIGA